MDRLICTSESLLMHLPCFASILLRSALNGCTPPPQLGPLLKVFLGLERKDAATLHETSCGGFSSVLSFTQKYPGLVVMLTAAP